MLINAPRDVDGGTLTLLGLAGVSVAFFAYCVYQRFLSPLAKYPGPFWASITSIWFAQQHNNPDVHRRILRLHEKYGPVVRVKPDKLSIASTDAFKTIYSAGNNYIKGESYVPFKGKRTFDLFGERNERVHGQQRRLVGGGYTMETMKTLEPYVNETVKVLLKKMEDTGTNGRVIEFAYLTHLFAFDVIGEVTFARRFGYIEAGSDFGLFGTIAKTLLSGVWVGEIPWLYHLHQRLVPLIGNHLAINARNGYLHDFTLKQMAARKERAAAGADDHNSDILSKLLAASRAKPQLSESDIGFTLTSNVIAGSDTTAVSMSAIVYYLLVTPAAKDRLLRELREKVVAGDVDADGIVPAAVGEKWPFLQAVIHEGMRMHPALGGLLARVVPPAGLRFGENFVPGGVEVGTSPWVIHRNNDIFGDDVETFRPERWLDEKRKTDMRKCERAKTFAGFCFCPTLTPFQDRFFFGFGGGSRTCVGKNISMLELNKISNDKPGPEEKFYSNIVGFGPIYVVARKRSILEESSE